MFCVYVNGVVLNLVYNLSPLIALAIKHKVCLKSFNKRYGNNVQKFANRIICVNIH